MIVDSALTSLDARSLAPYGYELQALVDKYPWFALGQKLLFKSLCGLGGEAYMSQLERSAVCCPSRRELLCILNESRRQAENEAASAEGNEITDDKPSVKTDDSTFVNTDDRPVGRVTVVGGDYFNREDYGSLKLDKDDVLDRFISRRPHLSNTAAVAETESVKRENEVSRSDDFVTETLARVYAQQGYFKLAVECYKKLILLYPQKSSYFGALIEDIKKETNNN